MWSIIFRAIIGAGIVYAVKELFSSDEVTVTNKSDCHNNFIHFNRSISISSEKKSNLKSAHNTIRNKLISYFSNYPNIPPIQFFIQGSYKMGTMVENMNQFSDIDLGIYFEEKPNIEIGNLQWHIQKALTGHTSRNVEIKKMCVRLNYVRDFHIDLPIYYKTYYGTTYFGTKAYGWQKSDPKDFIKWFQKNTRNNPQLIRIIRYLKAWSDYRKHKTNKKFPSGLVLTLWAIKYYSADPRDDVAFVYTCDKILEYLDEIYKSDWEACMPVAPFDNTLDRLTTYQKENFYNDFKDMIDDAIEAIGASSYSKAKSNWRKIFGYRFN